MTKRMRSTCSNFLEVTPSMRMTEVFFNRAARFGAFPIAVAILLVHAPSAYAAAGNTGLKIYEIAGAGALSGATYRQDTIILYNPTLAAITCSTCAIQTHSGTSNTAAWTVYKLPTLTILPGGYYMIAASSPSLASIGALPPTSTPYDYRLKTIEGTTCDAIAGSCTAIDNILSSTVGVVALTNTQTAL